ncbi:Heme oxygenase [Granulibacter bethesdensis]|uniref:Heme oxygenase n=1 Tax=Granulibacter bethesdensis TaxID=364410 RepID=A0AAN0RC51_9PROT|nr:biliverdin-producing heme oxygenase [Granulibacter bethesdensis]AHJ62044.1 Heme oxygenase [Granulibacter bethesdensis]
MQDNLSITLKQQTYSYHDRLDRIVRKLLITLDGYRHFLTAQYCFHRDIVPLYQKKALLQLIPDLAERNRLPAIEADAAALGLTLPSMQSAIPTGAKDTSAALGWLYVAEGSKLGAAHIARQLERHGLHDTYGLQHLHLGRDGVSGGWLHFRSMLDHTAVEAEQCIRHAQQAFLRITRYLEFPA